MKKFSLLLMMALVAIAAWGVPAKRGSITHRQKDGTELTLSLVGDEYLHYYVNLATGEKMEMGPDGDFYAISATTMKARTASGEARREAANSARVQRLPRMQQMAASTADGRMKAIGSYSNMTGQKKGLVILVNFKDKQFKSANNQAAFNNQFNKEGYNANNHIGSVKDYFMTQSYGNFSIDFDVVGPVTVSQNMAYYGANDSNGEDEHPAEMVIEALKLADNLGVDYSKYDWGGDGYVDQVFVVYAGYAEAQGAPANTIWPHEWALSSAKTYGDGTGRQRIDGKYIDTYACTAELSGSSGSTMDGIGTACHEFSHCLGYPDLYDTSGGTCWGMDAFDLMDYGSYSGPNEHGEVPCGYSAYERWMAGWLTPTVLTPGDEITVTNMPALNDQPVAYVIYNDKTSNEYLLIENRQNRGYFKYLRNTSTGHGLLITHVDYNSSSWSDNSVNTSSAHERFKYIAADKKYLGSNLPNDYFGPISKVTALTSTSHTSSGGQWFNNTKAGSKTFANMDITNIAESNGLISFDFNGGAPQDDGSRYTLTFIQNGVQVARLTQTSYREALNIPTIADEFNDWYPMGWSINDYVGNCAFEAAEFVNGLTEGQPYVPTENLTLYAVYSDYDMTHCTSHPVEADNTITLNVLGSTYSTWTQTQSERTFTLPSIESTVTDWSFVGWATSTIDNTTNKPTLLNAGTEVRPNADVTYYAVFSSKAGQWGGNLYRLVDTPESGAEYVIATANAVGSAYALDASKLSTTGAKPVDGAAVTIVDNSGIAIDNPADDLVWTATYSNNRWHLQNGDNYLVINGSGISYKTSSADLYWSNSYGLSGKSGSGATSYYLYGNGSTLTTRTSGKTDSRIYLYKGGGAVTYYTTSPAAQDHTVTFDAGSGSCSVASFTQNHDTGAVSTTLPSATINVDGWSFAGWASSEVAETTTKPEMYLAGADFTPLFDLTLYAVYTATSYEGAVKTTHYCSRPTATPVSTFFSVSLSNGTELIDEVWTQSPDNATFTLPTPGNTYPGWTFYGWSATAVAQTPDAPSIRAAGTTITPAADITFYSVFVNAKPAYISNPDLYVPGGGTLDPQFYFPHIAHLGATFIEPRFNSDSTGALTFSSSNTAVAEVDATTGKVTIKAVGTAIITATQAASASHRATSASYMIKVVE